MNIKNNLKKLTNCRILKVCIIIFIILFVGFLHQKNLLKKYRENILEAKEIDKKSQHTQSVLLNTNLFNKSIDDKKEYLLNNFNMDYVIGQELAPVTIIDYSSFTCIYCKKMRKEINKVIEKYVNNGIVKYVLRPVYSKNTLPLGAFLNCIKDERRVSVYEEFFKIKWQKIENLNNKLIEIAKYFKLDENNVKKCMYDKEIYEKLIYMQRENGSIFNIEATPMLVINGKEYVGFRTFKEIEEIINANLKK